jgi:hypothetical protein
MDGDDNLRISEQIIARIVTTLAERGVKTETLSAGDLSFKDVQIEPAFFVDAIKWLEAEGIIRSRMSNPVGVDGTAIGFVLTAYGFHLLDQNFKGEMKLGRAVKEVAQNGRSWTNVGEVLGGIMGGFTKSIGS